MLRPGTHAQTDKQVENIMPPAANMMNGGNIKMPVRDDRQHIAWIELNLYI